MLQDLRKILNAMSKNNLIIFQAFHGPMTNSVPKSKLCRTANSIHGAHHVCKTGGGPGDISNNEKGLITKTLSEKFSHLGIRQYSLFKNGK